MRFDLSMIHEKRFVMTENGYNYTLPNDVIVTLHYSPNGQLESVSWEKKEFSQQEEDCKDA